MGRNAKAKWTSEWSQEASMPERQQRALRSPFLKNSLEAYGAAFKEDLNHFYSGLNTLAMLTIQIKLAELRPEVWGERFDDDDEASRELSLRTKQIQKLSASVDLSLKATSEHLRREDLTDIWAEISEADLCLLTSNRPGKVSDAYRNALAGAKDFEVDAVRRQILLYRDLGLLPENVQAALRSSGRNSASPAPPVPSAPETHTTLYGSHD